jgi:hypothetical protein
MVQLVSDVISGHITLAICQVTLCKYTTVVDKICIYLFHGASPPNGPGPSHDQDFTFILRHPTLSRTPLDD